MAYGKCRMQQVTVNLDFVFRYTYSNAVRPPTATRQQSQQCNNNTITIREQQQQHHLYKNIHNSNTHKGTRADSIKRLTNALSEMQMLGKNT